MVVSSLTGLGRPLQVTELIQALLNAPVSEVLIVAGIVFLGIAIAGKIPGWMEPGQQGRKFGLVIGSFLLITGLAMHVGLPPANDNDPTPDGSTPTLSTPSPSPPTELDTPTPTLDSFSFPAGVAVAGFTDVDRAVDNHLRAVSKQSFRASFTFRRDETVNEIEVVADPEARRVHKIWRRDGTIVSELWFDSGAAQARTPSGGGGGFDPDDAVSFAAATIVEGQFDRFFYSELSDPQAHITQGQPVVSFFVNSTRDDHEGELTIAENGLFLAYDLRIQLDGDQTFVQYLVTDLRQTSVDEPGWVE